MKTTYLLLALCCTFAAQAQLLPKPLDTLYTETYSGFADGELGDCLQDQKFCNPKITTIYPLNAISYMHQLLYKRMYDDSSKNYIRREYVRQTENTFLYVEYKNPERYLKNYGTLYLDYKTPVVDTVYQYDSLFNEIPKEVLMVQPIQIKRVGLWQEMSGDAVKAGYYDNDFPTGVWKFFSYAILADFDLPSQIWNYKNGAIVKRDTLNILEKKPTEKELRTAYTRTWINTWESESFILFTLETRKQNYETWSFSSNGKLVIEAILGNKSSKRFDGTFEFDAKEVSIKMDVPEFATTTLKFFYLDKHRLLLRKK